MAAPRSPLDPTAGQPSSAPTGPWPQTDGILDLGWETFGELCRALALKVAHSGYAPEMVLGIATGGVIPGAVIASMLGCDFYSMKITRRTGGDRASEEPQVLTAAPRQAAGRRVLIVDEICATGATLRLATAAVRHVGATEIRTATSFAMPGGYLPDFYTLQTDATVVFPWDRQVVTADGELISNPAYRNLS